MTGAEPASSKESTAPRITPLVTGLREEKGWKEVEMEQKMPQARLWNYSAYGEHYFSTDLYRDFSFTGLNLEAERRFEGEWERYFSVGAITGFHYAQGKSSYWLDPNLYEADTFGMSLAAVGRVYLIEIDRFSFFIEGSPGVVFFNEDFPPNGSPVNFMARYGAGVKVRVDEDIEVVVGYRRLFIGNGGGSDPGNPTYEGNGFIIGAGVKF